MEAAVTGARLRLVGVTQEDERLGGSSSSARPSTGDQAGAWTGCTQSSPCWHRAPPASRTLGSVPWLYPSPFLLTSDLPRSLLIALSSRSPAKSNSCRNRLSTLAQKAPACWLRYSLLFSLDRLWLD